MGALLHPVGIFFIERPARGILVDVAADAGEILFIPHDVFNDAEGRQTAPLLRIGDPKLLR